MASGHGILVDHSFKALQCLFGSLGAKMAILEFFAPVMPKNLAVKILFLTAAMFINQYQ